LLRSDIRFLGVSGSKSHHIGTTSLQVAFNILIDGGNIIDLLKDDSRFIEHIFLTHSHLDHICDIPYLFDINYEKLKTPITIYGLKETIEHLKKYMFNDKIWPDFSKINLMHGNQPALVYEILEFDKTYTFNDVSLTPIELNHTVDTCGYVIQKPDYKCIFAPDTKASQNLLNKIKEHKVDSLIVDCSYPSRLESLAEISGHFSTSSLKEELAKIEENINIYLVHLKSTYHREIETEVRIFNLLRGEGRIIRQGEFLLDADFREYEQKKIDFVKLISKEKKLDNILKTILIETMKITGSDGGTIYLKENDSLKFKTVINQKLNIFSSDIDWPNIPLYIDGKENKTNVSALCAITKKVINIEDVYESEEFNFEGTKVFDKKNNYRSKSMLVMPLTDHDDEIIGVLQLINKNNFLSIQSFTKEDEDDIASYAIYAATAITKNKLIEDMENLFLSFITSIAFAINKKSNYGYNHIKNVEKLMRLMVFAINRDNTVFKEKRYTKDEEKELTISAIIHDIGKITTPDYILNKQTRLSGLHDKIDEIRERFLNAINSLKIDQLKLEVSSLKGEVDVDIEKVKTAYQKEINLLIENFNYIQKINNPAISLCDEDIEKIKLISRMSYQSDQGTRKLLDSFDVENLSVKYGNLTDEEREKINQHAKVGYDMLSHLKFPKKFAKIPEIAGFHHEKLNGTGYPFGLTADKISREVRMLAICDIFEALTSSDRPYKRAKSKSEAFAIMDDMANKNEIDKELFEFFKKSGIFDTYLDEIKLSTPAEFLALS